MKNSKKLILIIFSIGWFLIMVNCSSRKNSKKTISKPASQETLIKINQSLVKKDQEMIKNYISRHSWEMKQTRSGLWYMIYEHGKGEKALEGKYATLSYTLHLLDGTFCYSADSLHPKTFLIGQGGVETGLEEGILLLSEGDKARFIIPPYLAWGLLGDEKKIPPRATLVYNVELLKITDKP